MTDQQGAPKPKLPAVDEATHWRGLPVDGIDGNLGRVAGLHVDARDGESRWVVLRLGRLAGCTAIPFEHVAEGAGRLWAAYPRDLVREAPRFNPGHALTAGHEIELGAFWGVAEGQGRSAELADRAADEITAVPAGE